MVSKTNVEKQFRTFYRPHTNKKLLKQNQITASGYWEGVTVHWNQAFVSPALVWTYNFSELFQKICTAWSLGSKSAWQNRKFLHDQTVLEGGPFLWPIWLEPSEGHYDDCCWHMGLDSEIKNWVARGIAKNYNI